MSDTNKDGAPETTVASQEQSGQPERQTPQQPSQPPQAQQLPQQPYGYQQQPPQQPYGYQPQPPQQPYGYQPQQPYGYQQQPPQQPYGYQPQPQYIAQPVVVAPITAAPVTATPAEKEAVFSTAGSILMLIVCIVGTINLLAGLINDVFAFNFGGLALVVLEILIVVGMWVTFANGRRKKLASNGISLIRIPYVIEFVFSVFGFIGNLFLWFFTFNILNLLCGIIAFVIQCICFASINKTLKMARDINQNKSVRGQKAGSFAAIIMIISASFTLISGIVQYATSEIIRAALQVAFQAADVPDAIIDALCGGGSPMTIVSLVVAFLAGIAGAIVMLQFGKKIKEANGG